MCFSILWLCQYDARGRTILLWGAAETYSLHRKVEVSNCFFKDNLAAASQAAFSFDMISTVTAHQPGLWSDTLEVAMHDVVIEEAAIVVPVAACADLNGLCDTDHYRPYLSAWMVWRPVVPELLGYAISVTMKNINATLVLAPGMNQDVQPDINEDDTNLDNRMPQNVLQHMGYTEFGLLRLTRPYTWLNLLSNGHALWVDISNVWYYGHIDYSSVEGLNTGQIIFSHVAMAMPLIVLRGPQLVSTNASRVIQLRNSLLVGCGTGSCVDFAHLSDVDTSLVSPVLPIEPVQATPVEDLASIWDRLVLTAAPARSFSSECRPTSSICFDSRANRGSSSVPFAANSRFGLTIDNIQLDNRIALPWLQVGARSEARTIFTAVESCGGTRSLSVSIAQVSFSALSPRRTRSAVAMPVQYFPSQTIPPPASSPKSSPNAIWLYKVAAADGEIPAQQRAGDNSSFVLWTAVTVPSTMQSSTENELFLGTPRLSTDADQPITCNLSVASMIQTSTWDALPPNIVFIVVGLYSHPVISPRISDSNVALTTTVSAFRLVTTYLWHSTMRIDIHTVQPVGGQQVAPPGVGSPFRRQLISIRDVDSGILNRLAARLTQSPVVHGSFDHMEIISMSSCNVTLHGFHFKTAAHNAALFFEALRLQAVQTVFAQNGQLDIRIRNELAIMAGVDITAISVAPSEEACLTPSGELTVAEKTTCDLWIPRSSVVVRNVVVHTALDSKEPISPVVAMTADGDAVDDLAGGRLTVQLSNVSITADDTRQQQCIKLAAGYILMHDVVLLNCAASPTQSAVAVDARRLDWIAVVVNACRSCVGISCRSPCVQLRAYDNVTIERTLARCVADALNTASARCIDIQLLPVLSTDSAWVSISQMNFILK